MKAYSSIKTPSWSAWITLPLRLFMGVTFLYAGLQKLTDPQYFDPTARGYIGHQIAAFANGSPLHVFLSTVAIPHATLFGGLVAYGELAIGLGVLLGLFSRLAAFCGLLLNLLFFLSADWHIFPYFYGSDIVFLFCWLTLFIAGPTNAWLPALDTWLVTRLVAGASPKSQERRARLCAWLFGVQVGPARLPQEQDVNIPAESSTTHFRVTPSEEVRQQSRRNFVFGALSGGAVMLVATLVAQALHILPDSNAGTNTASAGSEITPTLGSPVPEATPTSISANGVIAQIKSVPLNSSSSFTLASNGDPGILIHLSNGQFVAFNATCTHAGCPVDYDPTGHQLICPCHGATFDPARAAAVTNGPAQTPLASVPIKVDQSAGTVSLG